MSKAFIRTYLKTNKYKNFYRHNFLIGKSPNNIKEKLDNIYLSNNSMIYVSNGYLMLDLENNFNNLGINEHIKVIENIIKQKQEEEGKTGFKNILNILDKNKKDLGIISIVEYIDEITLDYDSGLSLLEDINIDELSKFSLDSVLDLEQNKYFIDLLINKSIKKKDKISKLFIGFKEHVNYFLSILENYNFLTLDKIFITKYLDGIDVKNFQITFKIKEKALTKIIYNTLFNKITKGIYDKALKNAGQLKIYKIGNKLKRKITFFGQDINLKVKKYDLENKDIKSIENVSFKKVLIQHIRNKIDDNIDLSNYKNKQYYLNTDLINSVSIYNLYTIVYFIKNYYKGILENTIPNYKKKLDQIIQYIDNKIIYKINNDLKKTDLNINNLDFILSLSFIKKNQNNKIKLLEHTLTKLKILYQKERDNALENSKILELLGLILNIHKQFFKLNQYKYKKVKNISMSNIKKNTDLIYLLKSNKNIQIYNPKSIKKKIKVLVGLVGNKFTDKEKDETKFISKVLKNKNIYYNYLSFINNKKNSNTNLKYHTNKNLSFGSISRHFYNIFSSKKFENILIKKHSLLDYLVNLLENIEKKIGKKKQKETSFQNFIIYNSKLKKIKTIRQQLLESKNGKNLSYNIKKIVNFIKKHEFIIEEIFNFYLKTEGKVSKSLFLIQKDFFNIISLNISNKEQNGINKKTMLKKTIKSNNTNQNNDYELYIKKSIINKIYSNYHNNYYDGNRYNFITWTFFYLKNKLNYYNEHKNRKGTNTVENIIMNIEQIINIETFISEHGNYLLDQMKKNIPI